MALSPVSVSDLEVQAVKTAIVFVLVSVSLRVLGKREAAQLSLYDLAMLAALANAVQNAMTAGKGNFPIGLVASSTIILLGWLVTRLMIRVPSTQRVILGEPTILVHHGEVLADNLRRQRITRSNLEMALRGYGLDSASRVLTAVLEVDGSITVVSDPHPGRSKEPPDPGDAGP